MRALSSSPQGRANGMTLVELLCAMTLALLVLGATLVTFVAVQRSFLASLHQVNAQGDQHRVFAYLRRDLRGASSVQVASQGTQLTMRVPQQSAPTLNLNLGASLLSLLAPPEDATTSTTIRYYRQGTSILREVDGVVTELSSSATQFQTELSGSLVRIDASFQPRFSLGVKVSAPAVTQATARVHLLNAVAL